MHSYKPTYNSVELHARDKRVLDKYDKRENEMQRQHAFAQGQTTMTLYDLSNRANRLAELVGYEDIHEAIKEIETADIGATFRECLHRLQAAEARLEVEKMDSEVRRIKLEKLEKAHQALKEGNRELGQHYHQLRAEKKDLESRYDRLADVRRRSEERYKADYKTWRHTYRWLKSDGPDEDHPQVSAKLKKTLTKLVPSIAQKRQLIIDGLLDISFMENHIDDFDTPTSTPKSSPKSQDTRLGGSEKKTNKENRVPSISPRKKQKMSKMAASLLPFSNKLLQPATNTVDCPISSPSHILIPPQDVQVEQQQPPLQSPSQSSSTESDTPPASQHVADSSETEPDTQSIWIPMKRPLEPPSTFKTPLPPMASSSKITPDTNSSSRTLVNDPTPVPKRLRASLAEPVREIGFSPSKNLRYSLYERPSNAPSDVFTSRKGKERQLQSENDDTITDKYSIFKGHGRYGKAREPDPGNTTINSMFAINVTNNGGLDYQYDEVIRNRNARKNMHADDCECCREYYEAVGPLPGRLQQPLWRSPTSSPRKTECVGSGRRQTNIDSHKKAISRHRHTWARAPTPPGYWDIGFPNTQEVSAINAKATEMHKRKKEEVSMEAARGGRYRKKPY